MISSPDGFFLTIWYLSASVVVLLPLIVFGATRLAHDRGVYNHAEVYSDYKEGYNKYNSYMYANQAQEGASGSQDQEQWYPTPCKWWQWGCSDYVVGMSDGRAYNMNGGNNQYNNGNNNMNGNVYASSYNPYVDETPWWWWWSADERRKDQVIGVNPTLVIIYLWSLLLLGGIVYYGHKTLKGGRNMNSVTASLFLFANFSFMSMLYLGGLTGAVEDDGEVMLIYGWYGQFGVLMYMTYLLSTIFGIAFFVIVRGMIIRKNNERLGAADAEYVSYKECEIAAVADREPPVV